MDLETLHYLYMHELNDLNDAENPIIEALPKMIDAASDPNLRDALSSHFEETRQQARRLEQIFQAHHVASEDQTCKGLPLAPRSSPRLRRWSTMQWPRTAASGLGPIY